jgi:hypothetical protein
MRRRRRKGVKEGGRRSEMKLEVDAKFNCAFNNAKLLRM